MAHVTGTAGLMGLFCLLATGCEPERMEDPVDTGHDVATDSGSNDGGTTDGGDGDGGGTSDGGTPDDGGTDGGSADGGGADGGGDVDGGSGDGGGHDGGTDACEHLGSPGTWESLDSPYDARFRHEAVWSGTEMLFWGGVGTAGEALASGARYSPSTGWASMNSEGQPTPRVQAASAWAGDRFAYWGGSTEGTYGGGLATGAMYDPESDSWQEMATGTSAAPDARAYGHTLVYDDVNSQLLLLGGVADSTVFQGGARLRRIAEDSWTWSTMTDMPEASDARFGHCAIWTGESMVVWGGRDLSTYKDPSRVLIFTPGDSGSWEVLETSGDIPDASASGQCAYGDGRLFVFGGTTETGGWLEPGAVLDVDSGTWTDLPTAGAPGYRSEHTVVWTGCDFVVWGGKNESGESLDDGARYDPTSETWTTLTGTGAPAARNLHTAVWTGESMIVFGGLDNESGGSSAMGNGGIWTP